MIQYIDLIGFIAFIIALYYGFRNIRMTVAMTPIWILFFAAMIFASAWSLIWTLMSFGFYPNIMEALKESFFIVVATIISLNAVLSWIEIIKIQV